MIEQTVAFHPALLRPVPALRRTNPWLLVTALFVVFLLLTGAVGLALSQQVFEPDAKAAGARAIKAAQQNPPFRVEDLSVSPDKLEAISPDDALSRNKAIPVAAIANPAAKAFLLTDKGASDWDRAVRCLTAAIYYEAAFEPEDGQRAVAQVVLNRMRHPLYPKTVCGVVFEGHERKTGCQFSFTCDGSLARTPEPRLWERVRKLAAAALSGSVYSPVGWATNYHADYVVPYWIANLLKVKVVGRHIFYRLPGSYGAPPAFSLAYAGNEPAIPGEDETLLAAGEGIEGEKGAVALLSQRPLLENDAAAAATPQAPKLRATARWLVPMDGAAAPASPVAANDAAGTLGQTTPKS